MKKRIIPTLDGEDEMKGEVSLWLLAAVIFMLGACAPGHTALLKLS